MTRDEAKLYLQSCVPGATDPADPRLAEALRVAETDAELAAWTELWKHDQALDRQMAAVVRQAPVPPTLRRRLRQALAPKPAWFWQVDFTPYLRHLRAPWAAAAAGVLFLGVVGLAAMREPLTFARYRAEVIEASWDANPHLEFRSSDPREVQAWLKERGFVLPEVLPRPVAGARLQGCRLIAWRGHQVAMLCLFEQDRRYHLFIADDLQVENLPWEDKPDFEDVGQWKRSWKTIAWTVGPRTYVLAGMKYPVFTQRAYKDGVWQLSF